MRGCDFPTAIDRREVRGCGFATAITARKGWFERMITEYNGVNGGGEQGKTNGAEESMRGCGFPTAIYRKMDAGVIS